MNDYRENTIIITRLGPWFSARQWFGPRDSLLGNILSARLALNSRRYCDLTRSNSIMYLQLLFGFVKLFRNFRD